MNIETSTNVCSVALHQEGQLLSNQLHHVEKSHSSLLPEIVLNICHEAGVTIKDIHAVGVSEGPGSYTGLRIGVSTAKGFAYTLKVPIIAIPTLDIMLEAVRGNFKGEFYLCPMIDARRMEVYTKMEDQDAKQIWGVQSNILDEHSFSEFKKILYLFGNGMPKFSKIVDQKNIIFIQDIFPDAVNMGRIAWEKYRTQSFVDIACFEPNYLKEWRRTTTPKKQLI